MFQSIVDKCGPCSRQVSKIDRFWWKVSTEVKAEIVPVTAYTDLKMKQAVQEAFHLHGQDTSQFPTISIK